MEGMTMGAPPPPGAAAMAAKKSLMHMTLFWGKDSIILFKGWPGTRTGMYALALLICFLFSFLVEWLSHCRLTRPSWSPSRKALLHTVMHTVRVGLALLIMLALMSFNVGVLLATVAGHFVGFFLFSGAVSSKTAHHPDLPPYDCCS